jgi:asparagine synthase (glutamine-hydrolysing)
MTLDLADRSAAAFGVETRYPFFDRRVIEFCLGLPEEQKFAGGWPRLLLRRAMDGILPPEIQWRTTKANLSPNFHRRFGAVDIARRDHFEGAGLSRYLQPDRVREMAARYRARGDGHDMKVEALTLFRASIFAEWLDSLTNETERTRLEAGMPAPAAA